jgi:hypothetical protein
MIIGRRQHPLLLRTSLICFLQLLVLLSSYSFRQAHSIDLEIWKQKFEGENADMYSGGSERASNNPKYKGYTGNGYADFGGMGSFVQWEIETTFNKAEYDIIIRYSSPNQRSCYLYVDQIKRGDYSIDPTDSWNDWKSESLTVSLEKGKHQIKIVVVGDGGPNIDSMIITGQASMDGDNNDNDNENNIIRGVTTLAKDSKLSRGQFILSPSGHYKIGLVDTTGELVVMDNNSNSITWSNGVLGGQTSFMQGDGNLVVRNDDSKAIWNTESSGNDGAHLTIDDTGIASIVLNINDDNNNSYNKIWTTTTNNDNNNNNNNNNNDKDDRNDLPTGKFGFAERVVLKSRGTLSRGEFVLSPSNKYNIGLNDVGDLRLQDSNQNTVWNANVEGCAMATMQPDGNLVLRDGNNKLIWTTHTSENPGAHLVVDDGGRLSVMMGQTAIWMEGGKFYSIQ